MNSRSTPSWFRHVERAAFWAGIFSQGLLSSTYMDWPSIHWAGKVVIIVGWMLIVEIARRQFWHWTRDKSKEKRDSDV